MHTPPTLHTPSTDSGLVPENTPSQTHHRRSATFHPAKPRDVSQLRIRPESVHVGPRRRALRPLGLCCGSFQAAQDRSTTPVLTSVAIRCPHRHRLAQVRRYRESEDRPGRNNQPNLAHARIEAAQEQPLIIGEQ